MKQNHENRKRIEVLYTKHYVWLLQSAKNITKNQLDAEDLVGELMIYLIEKGTPKLFYKDSYNLMYCYRFLQTRWLNKIVKYNKKRVRYGISTTTKLQYEPIDEVYSYEEDERIMKAYDSVQEELQKLSLTKDWAKVKLFDLYYGSDDTQLELAKKIGICKSTMFMNLKKIREHLKATCPNPFQHAE